MTDPQRIPCFGGPMDGQDAPICSRNYFDVFYPVEKGERLYYYGGVQVDADINRGRYTRCKFYRRVDLETGAVRYQLGYAFIWHTDVVADYRLTMEQDSKVEWIPSLEQIMQEELEATP